MTILSNTTVISNFATINQLDLLQRLYGRIFMPTAVYHEILAGIEEGYSFCETIKKQVAPINNNGWIDLTSLHNQTELQGLANLPTNIHQGEAECLVIAQQRDWLLLTDDRAARKIAKTWGVRLSGTLGCLIIAIEKGLCDLNVANNMLLQMVHFGYRSPVNDLSALL